MATKLSIGGKLKNKNLRNKRILVTAGPTWVPIDKVRVISNTSSGTTGVLLANKAINLGAHVTLLLGPIENNTEPLDKSVKLIRFRFFDELQKAIISELKSKKYDILIHAAAVSDYRPEKVHTGKIGSGFKKLVLKLTGTPKIIELIKKIAPSIRLVGFKFEIDSPKQKLIKKAKNLITRTGSELVIANTFIENRYTAFIVSRTGESGPIFSKKKLVKDLFNKIFF